MIITSISHVHIVFCDWCPHVTTYFVIGFHVTFDLLILKIAVSDNSNAKTKSETRTGLLHDNM